MVWRKADRLLAGFTLLEVLMAIVIFAVGVVFVAEGMGRSQQVFGISQNLMTAVEIANDKVVQSQLELIEAHEVRTGTEQGKEKISGREFRWSRGVDVYVDPTLKDATKMRQIKVIVEWKEGPRHNALKLDSLFLTRRNLQEGTGGGRTQP